MISPPEELNQHETIVAVEQESMPQTLRLFGALQANLDILSTQGAKFAQAQLKASSGGNGAEAAAQQTAIKELVTSTVAVSMQEVARELRKNKAAEAEWQRSGRCHRRPGAICIGGSNWQAILLVRFVCITSGVHRVSFWRLCAVPEA